MLATKHKNCHTAASETNVEYIQISVFRSRWLASTGFTEQNYEQEVCFRQVLETKQFSTGFPLQDFLWWPQVRQFPSNITAEIVILSQPGVLCPPKSPWPEVCRLMLCLLNQGHPVKSFRALKDSLCTSSGMPQKTHQDFFSPNKLF